MNPFLSTNETIDVDQLMERIQARIKEKKEAGLLRESEIHEIEMMELQPMPDFLEVPNIYEPHLFQDNFPADVLADPVIDESGFIKSILKKIRTILFPLIRFMTRPLVLELQTSLIGLQRQTPTVVQSREYIKLLHNTLNNVIFEMTKLKIEQETLKTKLKVLEDKIEFVENRERAIEKAIQ